MATTRLKTHAAILERQELVAESTWAFHFTKPAGFAFTPGQAIDVILEDAPATDAQSNRHTFSIVSAPFERELVIATRMRATAYKRELADLAEGARVGIEGPFGSLTLHRDRARAAVFIAGGIGITPFMSILRQAARDPLRQRLALLYSNRRPEDAAFLQELGALAEVNGNFRLIATMTAMAESTRGWKGARGVIGEDLIRAAAQGLDSPIYYLAGPPSMVAGMRATLNVAGIEGDDMRAEEFYGYY